MFEAARGIKTLDVSFDLILTSPYIRAFRTAEILAEVCDSKKLFETKNLVPEADPKAIIHEINQDFGTLKRVVLVSHEPFLTRLISLLLSGADTMAIDLRKGGFCGLSIESLTAGKCACLEWLMTSKQLARMSKRKH